MSATVLFIQTCFSLSPLVYKLWLLLVSFRDLTLELPFTLTHPKPERPVISQMVTLPYKSPAGEGGKKGEGEAGATGGGAEGKDEAKLNGDECKEPFELPTKGNPSN